MAADQERADRIRALKQDRPDLTWRRIAEYVGVTERAATDWQKKGGIEYDNAKKLAELFDVDIDYIWRGLAPEERAPSPFAGRDVDQDGLADRLDRIERALADARAEREEHAATIEKLLERQNVVLARIEAATVREEAAAERLDELSETARSLDRAARETLGRLQAAALPQAPGARTT